MDVFDHLIIGPVLPLQEARRPFVLFCDSRFAKLQEPSYIKHYGGNIRESCVTVSRGVPDDPLPLPWNLHGDNTHAIDATWKQALRRVVLGGLAVEPAIGVAIGIEQVMGLAVSRSEHGCAFKGADVENDKLGSGGT